ncbi:hypothetical protein Xen7305DRAFT_00009170 [Xenococcus sp. PCC 7305]|uniref:hypothetical protein n=1 Tax=Xenococcus sp. PCC 7305 TaxID=102125 RepID=UPI0002AC8ED5|nr:hypothetical protein [Xenococcus sp. PCC 7305]ELS01215.1 hypothetical protein Xen7305DRAFT_00009170 [Xenococcus sp. PCC 7305]
MTPNQEIQIQVHTDSDGMIHLDIPTDLIDQDLQLKVSFATPKPKSPQDEELQEILANAKPTSNLAEYAGKLNLTEDPLTFQENIRSEW